MIFLKHTHFLANLPKIAFFLWLLVTLPFSCISEYDVAENFEGSFVVVDGILKLSNNNYELDSTDFKVKLSVTTVSGSKSSTYQAPIKNAKAELVINQKNIVALSEVSNGVYFLKDKSILQKNSTYQLRFSIGAKQYESNIEVLPDSVAINKVFTEYNPAAANQAYRVFVDVNDIKGVKNYYNWTYNFWEKQIFCSQCYNVGNRLPPACTIEDLYPVQGSRVSVSTGCSGNCWDILRSKTVNSISDIFFDGNPLLKKEIGIVPYNFGQGCLVEVQQMSLTPAYYQYLELLKNQTTGAGGLVDTPPAILVGNVRNIKDNNEKVIGFFSVTNTVKKRFWLERKEAKSAGMQPLSEKNPSIPPPVGSNIPLKPCTPSEKRTNAKPVGWVE
jgi:hypothetical protein